MTATVLIETAEDRRRWKAITRDQLIEVRSAREGPPLLGVMTRVNQLPGLGDGAPE